VLPQAPAESGVGNEINVYGQRDEEKGRENEEGIKKFEFLRSEGGCQAIASAL
jgi:hypothetical protein